MNFSRKAVFGRAFSEFFRWLFAALFCKCFGGSWRLFFVKKCKACRKIGYAKQTILEETIYKEKNEVWAKSVRLIHRKKQPTYNII